MLETNAHDVVIELAGGWPLGVAPHDSLVNKGVAVKFFHLRRRSWQLGEKISDQLLESEEAKLDAVLVVVLEDKAVEHLGKTCSVATQQIQQHMFRHMELWNYPEPWRMSTHFGSAHAAVLWDQPHAPRQLHARIQKLTGSTSLASASTYKKGHGPVNLDSKHHHLNHLSQVEQSMIDCLSIYNLIHMIYHMIHICYSSCKRLTIGFSRLLTEACPSSHIVSSFISQICFPDIRSDLLTLMLCRSPDTIHSWQLPRSLLRATCPCQSLWHSHRADRS